MPAVRPLAGECTVARAWDLRRQMVTMPRLVQLVAGAARLRLFTPDGVMHEHALPPGGMALLAPGRREIRLAAGSTWRWLPLTESPDLPGPCTVLALPPRAHALLSALLAVLCVDGHAPLRPAALALVGALVRQGLPRTPGDPRLLALLDEVAADPGRVRGVADLEGRLGVSPAHLRRLFHAAVGLPPRRWLQEVRLRRARQLRDDLGLAPAEIAAQVGFDDARSLARLHRRVLGGAQRR